METIQLIINTVMSSIYLMVMCGIGLFLIMLAFTLNHKKIIHAMLSFIVEIEPYEEGKKIIRPKQREDEFSYLTVRSKSKSTHICSNCGSPHKI